ncbi:MAG: hypothetical protein N2512_11165 [Armatimonadetes bacterium]|nr:hypothetical protein [Armatimonadota bacterium]
MRHPRRRRYTSVNHGAIPGRPAPPRHRRGRPYDALELPLTGYDQDVEEYEYVIDYGPWAEYLDAQEGAGVQSYEGAAGDEDADGYEGGWEDESAGADASTDEYYEDFDEDEYTEVEVEEEEDEEEPDPHFGWWPYRSWGEIVVAAALADAMIRRGHLHFARKGSSETPEESQQSANCENQEALEEQGKQSWRGEHESHDEHAVAERHGEHACHHDDHAEHEQPAEHGEDAKHIEHGDYAEPEGHQEHEERGKHGQEK